VSHFGDGEVSESGKVTVASAPKGIGVVLVVKCWRCVGSVVLLGG
jgi:hypothetical protein